MGFRSTLATESPNKPWPEWFRAKWPWLTIPRHDGSLSVCYEQKFYPDDVEKLCADVAKAHREACGRQPGGYCSPFTMVLLHECGGITRYEVMHDGTVYITQPSGWKVVPESTHGGCYCLSQEAQDHGPT